MVITHEIVKQVARLAQLRLEGEALTHLAHQLDAILEYLKLLQAVDTSHIEPTSHVLPLTNVLRPDTPRPSLPQDAVLAIAPQAHAPFVSVPKVIVS